MTTKKTAAQKQKEANEEQAELIDKIEPDVAHRKWVIGPEGNSFEYTQKPLSYFAKLEFYALLADALDKAMMGDSSISISGLMEAGEVSFDNPDSFINILVKLVRFVPDVFEEAYCIFLSVPRGDRFMVKELMRLPEDEGGLSDDDGLKILEVFIEQNINAIEEFFTGRLPKMGKRVKVLSKLMSPASE